MNNSRAFEMYDLYQQGNSLSQVGRAYGVTRQSVYGMFKDRQLLLRAKKELPYVEFNGCKYTLANTGYYRKTDGDRELMHRDVWKSFYGHIPNGFDIHHKDENKANNTIGNLECLPTEDHTRLHNPRKPTPVVYCRYCNEQLVRKTKSDGAIEAPSALAKRRYCNPVCKAKHREAKLRGWNPKWNSQ